MSAALRATYRLMLGPGFGFEQARALIPYLRRLGISHLYLPPSFQARPGSTHGYDVIDPTRISEDLGGEAEFRALADDPKVIAQALQGQNIVELLAGRRAALRTGPVLSPAELRALEPARPARQSRRVHVDGRHRPHRRSNCRPA